MKTALLGGVFAVTIVLGGVLAAQNVRTSEPLEVIQLQPNLFMIGGAGGNIAVQFGPEGVVVVDSGTERTADAVLAAIKRLTDQPIRYIINTSVDADHVSGNERLSKAGRPFGRDAIGSTAANIIAAEPVLDRMSAPTGKEAPYPVAAWPTEAYTRKQKTLHLNNEGIQIVYQPAAHSDGDSIVLFRRSDVIVTGDIFDITRFPVIDTERGGSIQGEIDAMNRLVELAIPNIPLQFKDGGTQIIPGHGRVCEQAELVEYRDMLTIVRDSVKRLIEKGLTLDQIRAANPTQGYRARYGAESGPWTTDMFVEAIYRGLTVKP